MSPDFIKDLCAVLGAINADEIVMRQIRNGLFRVGRMHGVRDLIRMERHAFAIELLNKDVSRPTIMARLMSNFGIAKRQAYRDIEEALNIRGGQLCQTGYPPGTRQAENVSIEQGNAELPITPESAAL
jgi:hypothetical protein